MSNNQSDHGLEVLLKILHMKGLRDYENLLKKCYKIQKKYQYESERSSSLISMQKLLDEEILKKTEEMEGEKTQ